MKIALAADFHLDLRQFNRQQRWLDFVHTFAKVTKQVAQLNPNAYVIAGDLFEKYRPHPGVIRRFLKEVSRLQCPIILIRGNHDSPQIFFERYGGDILYLLQDVAEIVYLNRKNPSYELDDVCFIGLGYTGFNTRQEIADHVRSVKTRANTTVGIFHQLLDYPGVPEHRAEVSRGFLKALGLDYILMGHWHVRYEENGLFNPGSPEYWSFDQGEQVEVNLDTGEEETRPAKEKGFYLIDTLKRTGDFVTIDPARPMYRVTYKTKAFDEANHIPLLRKHLARFNVDGAMVKTIIQGRCKYGRITLGKEITLEKPLIHTIVTNLQPSDAAIEKVDTIKAQTEYLAEQNISRDTARKIAEWLEHNKDELARIQSHELLTALRSVLQQEKPSAPLIE